MDQVRQTPPWLQNIKEAQRPIVVILLTLTFCVLAWRGVIEADVVVGVFSLVIGKVWEQRRQEKEREQNQANLQNP